MTPPLSANALAFLDEEMPVFIGTTRSDGTVQINPMTDPRPVIRVRPVRVTGSIHERAA